MRLSKNVSLAKIILTKELCKNKSLVLRSDLRQIRL